MAWSKGSVGRISHIAPGMWVAVSDRIPQTRSICSQQPGSPTSRLDTTGHCNSTTGRCYNSFPLSLPATPPVKNRLFWGQNLEKRFLSTAPSYRTHPGGHRGKVLVAPHCLCPVPHRTTRFTLGCRAHLLWQKGPGCRGAEPRCRAVGLEWSGDD